MTRTAISPRLATRTLVKGGTGRVFSRTVSLPDQLTVARIAAVPIVVLLFAWDFPNHAYWATAVFVVAMATDQIDGWLARRRGVSSPLGKLLDPVADKVLVLATLVMLIFKLVRRRSLSGAHCCARCRHRLIAGQTVCPECGAETDVR